MNELIKKIIEYSVNAPSGDNSQPWRSVVEGNKINIFNLPDRDSTLYNFKHRGDYVAHGALIENIVITASQYGFKTNIRLFPDRNNSDLTTELTLEKDVPKKEPLYDSIEHRTTNRKPFKLDPLSEEQKKDIYKSVEDIGLGELFLIEDRNKIAALAKEISLNERLMLENKHIHDFLFSIIRWTEEEEKEKAGMCVKTLELLPPQLFIFKNIFRRWFLLKILNKIFKISRLLPKESQKLYSSSAAIGVITINNDSKENFIYAGRLFEQIWLKAVNMNFYIQPITAIPYLAQRVYSGETEKLSSGHTELIKKADSEIRKICNISETKTIAMIFRIGSSSPPSAHSAKLTSQIEFKN